MLHLLFVFFMMISSFTFASTPPEKNGIKIAELQWSLCESAASALQKLNLTVVQYSKMNQTNLDTQNFDLLGLQIQIRIRDDKNTFKSTLKINFADVNLIPGNLIKNQDTVCEFDKHIALEKVGCKTSNKTDQADPVISDDQLFFLRQFAPNVPTQNLLAHGPFTYEKWETTLKGKQAVTFDSLTSSSGHKYFEISIRVPAQDRQQLFQEWEQYFKTQKIAICADHVDRTRLVLTEKSLR